MKSIAIGIHVHAQAEELCATLESLRRYSSSAQLILFPDGPDPITAFRLRSFGLPQCGTSEPRGPAACFNRLATETDTAVVVLLESGCRAGPGWLEALLMALEASPGNGLAGPSTNRAWNEQCAFAGARGGSAAVAKTATEASQRFHGEWRTLEPLYSLADFCYVVRREVIDSIGGADEGYNTGPCWEMDYNIRAARAGLSGVWAGSSYVYRAPFTARRLKQEREGFADSRKRYQDKFCGLRIADAKAEYEPHCRGDACEHFAPKGLMEIALPSGLRSRASTGALPEQCEVAIGNELPLVSCVMTTRNRPEFVEQSIRYFLRQDYPHRELIILDDGPTDYGGRIVGDERVRSIGLSSQSSIGAKRNRGCELARGSLIAHWDDDDWYGPDRLSRQLAPILAGRADITGLQTGLILDLKPWAFWRLTPALHRRLFVEDVHGGTLVYKRSVWEQQARYPETSLAEDAAFLRRAVRAGARLERLPNSGSFIYLRHGANAWSFPCGKYIDPRGWLTASEPELSKEDREFYSVKSKAAAVTVAASVSFSIHSSWVPADAPLVSCIMPTFERPALVAQAIRYFLRQDYPQRELVIVDDGNESAESVIPRDASIRYIRLEGRSTIGHKRNVACENSRGTLIAHWDDDDWSADWRLSYQVKAMLETPGKAASGLSTMLYYDPAHKRAWRYQFPAQLRLWVGGGTLCYAKAVWRQYPFGDIDQGEDTQFVWSLPAGTIAPLGKHGFYVATMHSGNTSPKRTHHRWWQQASCSEILSVMGQDFEFYEKWPETLHSHGSLTSSVLLKEAAGDAGDGDQIGLQGPAAEGSAFVASGS